MAVAFDQSETKKNLMKAFAGESQARNRYTFAAGQAKQTGMYVIEVLFRYTADQEKEHAEVFYNHLKEAAGENILIEGSYPVDIAEDLVSLLRSAQHNEYEEHDPVYKTFGDVAMKEGFPQIASSFHQIAQIEKVHGDRFGKFADFLENGALFVSDVETRWICLNCGAMVEAKEAPAVCPVCHHDRGYFIRFELSPFEKG
ncbi:MAG: rubrerythrin family protein [Lachnospiraceae bacterium]|nr:rubrerythrin family protein [Lachnospiraceae bacterium]